MECVLAECMEMIIFHLHAHNVNHLMRTSKHIKESVRPHEEKYWSGTRVVGVYRNAALEDGMMELAWVSKYLPPQSFLMKPVAGAIQILKSLWQLREERRNELLSLFVQCRVFPDVFPTPIPCYLFKTAAAHKKLTQSTTLQHYSFETENLSAWPVYITCRQHCYRFCSWCPITERFTDQTLMLRVG